MTKKILCAIDGTEHARAAVDTAADLSKRLGVPLTVCTVNALTGGLRGPTIYLHEDSELDTMLSSARDQATKLGAKTVDAAVLKARDVAAAITQFAQQNGFDHIVTGTGGKGSVTRFVLGSVAGDVVARAHCTVTVAR
jgi:nucleotide-binding universal stress UspA family protein